MRSYVSEKKSELTKENNYEKKKSEGYLIKKNEATDSIIFLKKNSSKNEENIRKSISDNIYMNLKKKKKINGDSIEDNLNKNSDKSENISEIKNNLSDLNNENMNVYNSDNKKKNFLIGHAVFFTPKKNLVNTSNEKKEIENKILHNLNDENNLNNHLLNNYKWYNNNDQKKNDIFNNTIMKSKDVLSNVNNASSNINNNYNTNNNNIHLNNNNNNNNFNYNINNNNNFGLNDKTLNINSSLTFKTHSINTSNLNNINFLQNSVNNNENNENKLDYLNVSQYSSEKKKDIVYLFQELLSYCECLKRSRKKSTEEINKIRISYNKVSDLLKETLKREKNSHIKIEELRNIIINYNQKFDQVKNSSEGTITNLNKNVQTLIDLNNSLEIEMNKIVNENQQLRKIAQNEFALNKEINDLRKQIENLNNEKISLINQIDSLRLENSKIENEKNVLLSDKTLLHCKIDELENGLKNKNNIFNENNILEKENNPFIINSDEEINEQLNNYLNLSHDQRTELFKNFLYHWRETNKAGQKFYEQSYLINQKN
ncbi:conserved Plasmodium protein, unknown function [Plasmodium gallinaceum]|uniref:Uncharacterized protein n=1 Tax=Plasmodium gallinaceum TaxID=5849 RepID=A0A1J1GLS8_PLAGA|nr:conserved Plasmodium protein, unknown function [Plasmodium gallinaceum]CRG93366.1 conserved Plasmodium protein, unknown function [Plasmodium gallinaceum]